MSGMTLSICNSIWWGGWRQKDTWTSREASLKESMSSEFSNRPCLNIPTLSCGFWGHTHEDTTAHLCTHIYTICVNLPVKPFLKLCVGESVCTLQCTSGGHGETLGSTLFEIGSLPYFPAAHLRHSPAICPWEYWNHTLVIHDQLLQGFWLLTLRSLLSAWQAFLPKEPFFKCTVWWNQFNIQVS